METSMKTVKVKEDLVYGNPGQRIVLPAGTVAIAEPATNLPDDSHIHYWLTPQGEVSEDLERWAENVGCGVHTDDIEVL
jgi:hypothetical protein